MHVVKVNVVERRDGWMMKKKKKKTSTANRAIRCTRLTKKSSLGLVGFIFRPASKNRSINSNHQPEE